MEKKEKKRGVFNECLLIFFRLGVRTGRGEGEVSQIQTAADRGRGRSKITKNVQTSFMDGPQSMLLTFAPIKIFYSNTVYKNQTLRREYV